MDGNGYFDVRDQNDKWIRIQAEKGDLLVIPGGIYHRFIPTLDDYIKGADFFLCFSIKARWKGNSVQQVLFREN